MFQGSFSLLCIMDQFNVKAVAALRVYLILQGLINITLCPKKQYTNSSQRCTGKITHKIGFQGYEYFKPISRQSNMVVYLHTSGFLILT
jgi:hypothetical protein